MPYVSSSEWGTPLYDVPKGEDTRAACDAGKRLHPLAAAWGRGCDYMRLAAHVSSPLLYILKEVVMMRLLL